MKQASLMNDICIHENSIAHLKFTAQWSDQAGSHTAIQHVEKFNIWRDIDLLPEPLKNDILHHSVGKRESHTFTSGEIVPAWKSSQLITLPLQNFYGYLPAGRLPNRCLTNGSGVMPRAGRFYPKGLIKGVNGVYSENMFPVRLVEVRGDEIVVDFNHPLATQDIKLDVEIIDIFPPSDEHGGRCTDIVQEFLCNGPGMQMPSKDTPTDFNVESVFDRVDENADEVFYQKQRKVHHLDAHARKTISELYASAIKPGSRVLDLMSSWESHIPESIESIKVSGLGMNEAELKANPVLDDYLVHDLNKDPLLAYKNESFDSVICTASVEYLINPLKVFEQIKRVLKPGGLCYMTFSNRWFPTKSIMLWSELHEFERIGLVSEFFRQSGWEGDVNTLSSKGLHRPVDDPHYENTQISDPVYAVWCHK